MTIRRHLCALNLALAAVLPLSVAPTASAQNYGANNQQGASINAFQVEPAQRLRPGEVLFFRVNGTPGAQVSVQIAGTAGAMQLNETNPGVYEGEYTIRQRDRLTARSAATARLNWNGQTSEVALNRSLLVDGQASAQSTVAQISDFSVNGPGRARPGDELNFTLRGTPRAQASVALEGVKNRIALSETSPGEYEGRYVLRRSDQVRGTPVAEAHLISNRREVTRRYVSSDTLSNDGRNGQGQAVACNNCGRIESITQVDVDSGSKNIIGTVAGGVLGGVLGHQVGGGSGKDLATVIGAIGGAYAGNRIQNRNEKTRVHRIAVRMDDGALQNFDYAEDPQVQSGTLVRVENGVLVRR